MKKYLLIALIGCLALSGCSKSKDAETTAAATTIATTVAAETTTAAPTVPETEPVLLADDVIQRAMNVFDLSGDVSFHQVWNIDTIIKNTETSEAVLPDDTGLVSGVGESAADGEESEAVEVEETVESTEEAEPDISFDIPSEAPFGMSLDVDVSRIGSVSHTKGSFGIAFFMPSFVQEVESYSQVSGDIVKLYQHTIDDSVPDDVGWTVSESEYTEGDSLVTGSFIPLKDFIGKAKLSKDDVNGTYLVSKIFKYSEVTDESDSLMGYLKDSDITASYLIDADDFSVLNFSFSVQPGDYEAEDSICTVNAISNSVDFTWPPVGDSEIPADFISNAEEYNGRHISSIDGVNMVCDKDDNPIRPVDEAVESSDGSAESAIQPAN